ncbi:MAG: 3-hydroxyacyl-[acyl-carrier-protein] dehydratase FabZ, partial [Pseudomonadota bacterium]
MTHLEPGLDTLYIDDIKKILPHRYPFLMIDRLTNIDPGTGAVGIKNISVNEELFQGHFPQ